MDGQVLCLLRGCTASVVHLASLRPRSVPATIWWHSSQTPYGASTATLLVALRAVNLALGVWHLTSGPSGI